MSFLFEPCDFCGLRLKNRFARSAALESMAAAEKTYSPLVVHRATDAWILF